MEWQGPSFTPVLIQPGIKRIRYADHILMLGSCFSEHISTKLTGLKYSVLQNPFGILYNPVSLANAVNRIANRNYYTEQDLVFHGGLYHSMDHHGSFSGTNATTVLQRINDAIEQAHHHLSKIRFVCISPGTSWVYAFKESGKISGNCHKIPQAAFDRYPLTMDTCSIAFTQLYNDVKSISPAASLIWTVSPVRHLSEGLIMNQRSKATLIMSIAQLINALPGNEYFPAYEIMVDQLRDYRYYERDMTHPSDEAVDIIWNAFSNAYIESTELAFHSLIEKIHRARQHRLLHDEPTARSQFALGQLNSIQHLENQLPSLSWREERTYFESLL